jgi:AcrR family transcriptional regulator
MSPALRNSEADSRTRTALLDATQDLMLEEGYAAVSSRRVAVKAGLNAAGLVNYYFGTMDDLFIALYRRVADRNLAWQRLALSSAQPIWGLWESIYDQAETALLTEFTALGSHRKAVRAEIAATTRRIRMVQVEAVSSVLRAGGVDPGDWPPASVALLLAAISRFIVAEETAGIYDGHAETIALVEGHIRALEGDRSRTSCEPPIRKGIGSSK